MAAFVCETPSEKPPVEIKPIAELGKPLNETKTVFIDTSAKRIWLKAVVARDEGVLEMFLCKKGTKEHESVVAIDSPAFVIHAGLLALGIEPGAPASFGSEFVPPTGPKLEIVVHWVDPKGKRRTQKAKDWIRGVTQRWFTVECEPSLMKGIKLPKDLELRYFESDEELLWFGPMSDEQLQTIKRLSSKREWIEKVETLHKRTQSKPFEGDWVFSGSSFWTNQESGERQYLAESGNLICVANFGDAMIDVDTQSSSENSALLYEPWTERVPAPGTPVLVEIRKADEN